MKMGTKFVVRLAAWSALILYLLCDLVFFGGPLQKQVSKMHSSPEQKVLADRDRGIVARVFTIPIYLSQVDYAVDEALWRSGRTSESISQRERGELRVNALNELIDHAILREKVALNEDKFPVSEEEITAAIQRFASRFSTPQQMADTLKRFGYNGEKELKYRIAGRLQQNKYVESKISTGIAVSEEEAQAWYHDHKKGLTTPERINARHIFLSKLSHSEEDALAKLQKLKSTLETGVTFEALAFKHSADPRSSKVGGELGWLQRDRLPEDFADQVFALELHSPAIIATSIGWHLIEVTERQDAQLASFEQLKPEIIAALETSRRKSAVAEYRRNLRAQHPEKIIIHGELLSH
jgi:peptidyl-prolyl cis-trans isomerase C